MPELPAWANYEGSPFDDFTRWSIDRCARPRCGVVRWRHIANALAVQRGGIAYWQACASFVEPPSAGVPVAAKPSPTLSREVSRA